MSDYQIAGTVVAGVAVLMAIGFPLGAWIGKRLKEQREFDEHIESVANALGLLPGPPVRLDPDYRSPAYYVEARKFVRGIR